MAGLVRTGIYFNSEAWPRMSGASGGRTHTIFLPADFKSAASADSAIGSNYLMINGKPDTPSLLDLMPAWPVYIIYMEAMGIFMCLLLYLPFAVNDFRQKHQMAEDGSAPSHS